MPYYQAMLECGFLPNETDITPNIYTITFRKLKRHFKAFSVNSPLYCKPPYAISEGQLTPQDQHCKGLGELQRKG